MTCSPKPERTEIGDGKLEIPRMISGLWQLAGGHDQNIDVKLAASAMKPLIDAGLDCFDMADHYGDAELVMGQYNISPSREMTAFTKWCPPQDGNAAFEDAEEAVNKALTRMGQKQIALLQYHIWDYKDDTYLQNLHHLSLLHKQGKIGLLGMTNTDSAHLQLIIDSGFKIATNQISCSVIDRRLVRGDLASVCAKNNVGILAYGTLLGGFLSEKWLDLPEPQDQETLNASLRKYLRFIQAAGGWGPFQSVLRALSAVAQKHGVGIPAVATRHVLDIPVVSAVIVGSRLSSTSSSYITRNLAAFTFSLDDEDRAIISKAQEGLRDIPGDNGDEYRRAPYLTATGDLSDHLEKDETNLKVEEAAASGMRIEYSSGSKWEPIAGYCRAVRTNRVIRVSGTTANSPVPSIPVVGGSNARSQTVAILDNIARALEALGGSLSDVVRTRIMLQNESDCEEVSKAHGWAFGCLGVRPSNTMITAGVIGAEFIVEIEAEAVLGFNKSLRI